MIALIQFAEIDNDAINVHTSLILITEYIQGRQTPVIHIVNFNVTP